MTLPANKEKSRSSGKTRASREDTRIMANFGAHIPASLVKIELLDGPIDTHQPNREKVGEIYRLTPDHLAFVCAHCDEEFLLLIQFTAHIQSHLIEIHSDYIEPKKSPNDECIDVYGDGGVCTEVDKDHQTEANDTKPIAIKPTMPFAANTVDEDDDSTDAENDESRRAEDVQKYKLLQCPTCQKSFQSLALHLKRAKRCNPSLRTYECYLCRAPLKTKIKCKRHMREAHTGATRQCDHCGENVLRNLVRHRQFCGPTNAFKCERCPLSFRAVGLLNVHVRSVHGLKPKRKFRCKLCANVFDERAARLLHMQSVHSNATAFKCNRCLSYFAVRTDLIKHGIVCAGGNCTCRICGQTFDDQAARAAHMQTHEKKFQCDECGRQFLDNRLLIQHLNSHSSVAKFKCDECPKAYKFRSDLSAHKNTHRERAYKCNLCASSFHQKSSLQNHQWRVHRVTTNKKKLSEKFICSICDKILSDAYTLSDHVRRHTGENLLQCSQCDFKCPARSELDKHMLSHSDQRDFLCDLCPKTFKRKDNLVAHKRIHLGDFKFKCKWCAAAFHDNRIFKKHTMSAHGRRWDDNEMGDQT